MDGEGVVEGLQAKGKMQRDEVRQKYEQNRTKQNKGNFSNKKKTIQR